MNKTVKIILTVLVVLGVIILASLAGGKKNFKKISLEDYNKIVEKGGFVYYSQNGFSNTEIEDASKTIGSTINVLLSEEKVEGLKEGTLYQYENGKVVYDYAGELFGYKFTESLMKEGLIERNYLTVSFDEYKEIYKSSGYHLMFIGSATCGWCDKFKESITEALKDNNFNIYYIDISKLTQDEYNALVATDSYMSENNWGTPLNILYKDGKRVEVLNGYVPSDELVKFLKENKVI